ncbi:MAG: hypothetical protein A2X36_01705 [Elusimicrobia bacterium GWA2_69_24]|nr:MAG: hypothetical protein A2X36_01705 [Elusimicrobia bacterium GWA2_69_24]
MRSARRGARGVALLLLAGAASAAPWGKSNDSDIRRFGLDRPDTFSQNQIGRTQRAQDAIAQFNRDHRGQWSLRFGAQGIGAQSAGPARAAVSQVAHTFLAENASALGLIPDQLRLELGRTSGGMHHLLFNQIVDGIPVEFSRVKVHLDEGGRIVSLQSNFRPDAGSAPRIPAIAEAAAAQAVAADSGGGVPRNGQLVYYPVAEGSALRLAWKFRNPGAGGVYIYYVDALSGALLLRYDDLRQQSCQTSGTVRGMVYEVDPNTAPGLVALPIAHEKVYVRDASSGVLTNSSGFFCHTTTPGKIFTMLQGPHVNVAHFTGASAHYNNGSGVWDTYDTAWSSPSPYADNLVLTHTLSVPTWKNAVMVLPRFSAFDVGQLGIDFGELIVGDNDQVAVLDGNGQMVATYIGNRSAFNGAAVAGNQYQVRLRTNESGGHQGFTVSISSYLTLSNASTPDNMTATFTWSGSHTRDASLDEVNVFYQLNKMHDYFRQGPNSQGLADIEKPITAMVHVGPSLGNAFYDPFHQNLAFGDDRDAFAFDGTVVRHEYTHFVVDQIYPIINFGQFGAISEAMADYFSATSFSTSSIGSYTNSRYLISGPLRELDCPAKTTCRDFPAHWTGSIYDGALMLSQGLWELRTDLRSSLGTANGTTCADGLVFQSLFFFPDSFVDFMDAMLTVSQRSSTLVPECGADGTQDGLIQSKLGGHGISMTSMDTQDAYEPNDGIASATDITTATVVTARLYKTNGYMADLDYYTFGAGPGRIRVTVSLPAIPDLSGYYYVHALTLVDTRFNIVAEAMPGIDNPTLPGGYCPEPPETFCRTTNQTLTLDYDNPSPDQFFLLVAPPSGENGLIGKNYSTAFYSLNAEYNRTGPVTSGIVTAAFDNDLLSWEVRVTSFVTNQGFTFHHAQLRSQALDILSRTATNAAGTYLTFVSSHNASGMITGSARLAPGFNDRFPGAGTVHLEVFGQNRLGNVQSLGFSQPLNLSTNRAALTAFNNIFNPMKGEKATFRYDIQDAGHVRLRLFTLSGNLVATLIDEDKPAGKGSLDWAGANLNGVRVASGIYYLNLQAPGINETKKVIVVK